METITSFTVVSDSKISGNIRYRAANETTLYLHIIHARIRLHYHRELHAELMGGHSCFELLSHGYQSVVPRDDFHVELVPFLFVLQESLHFGALTAHISSSTIFPAHRKRLPFRRFGNKYSSCTSMVTPRGSPCVP